MHVHVYMCCNLPGHACAMAAGALCNVSYWPGATQGRAATTGTCTGGVDTKIRVEQPSSNSTPILSLAACVCFFLALEFSLQIPGFMNPGFGPMVG